MKSLFLNIGHKKSIPIKSIVAMLDADSATIEKPTRTFLKNLEKQGKVISAGDLPNTFILTNDREGTKLYLSSFSVSALKKRFEESGY